MGIVMCSDNREAILSLSTLEHKHMTNTIQKSPSHSHVQDIAFILLYEFACTCSSLTCNNFLASTAIPSNQDLLWENTCLSLLNDAHSRRKEGKKRLILL